MMTGKLLGESGKKIIDNVVFKSEITAAVLSFGGNGFHSYSFAKTICTCVINREFP